MTADSDVMDYALSQDQRIGWRHDCLGSNTLDEGLNTNPGYRGHMDRWQTAPIFWEGCGAATSVRTAHDQVIRYHFAGGHTMNQPTPGGLTASDQTLLREYRELAGYRFQLNSLVLPERLSPGGQFTLTTTWSNIGLTPAYTPWTLQLQFRDVSTGNVVWQGPSTFDFQAFLPTRDPLTGHDAPATRAEVLTLADSVPAGAYAVFALAVDPSAYYQPLRLANVGRQDDGSYALGLVEVTP
jgi:hypothetical protein